MKVRLIAKLTSFHSRFHFILGDHAIEQAKKVKKSRSTSSNSSANSSNSENVKSPAPKTSAQSRSSPSNDFVWTKHVCGSSTSSQQDHDMSFTSTPSQSDSSNCSSGQETVTTSNTSSNNISNASTTSKSYNTKLSADAFSAQGYVAMITSSSSEDDDEQQNQHKATITPGKRVEKQSFEANASSSDSDVTTCTSNVSNKASSPRRRYYYQSTEYTMLPTAFADDAPPKQKQQPHLPPKPRYYQPRTSHSLSPIIQTTRSSGSRSTQNTSNKSKKSMNRHPHYFTHNKAFEIVRRNNLRFECTQNSSSDDDVLTQIARETRRMRLQRRYNSVSPCRSKSSQYEFDNSKNDPVPNAATVSSESDNSDDSSSSSDGHSHVSSTASSQHDSQAIRDARVQRLRSQWGVGNVNKAQQTKPTVTFQSKETVYESHGTNTNTTESVLRQGWFYSQK